MVKIEGWMYPFCMSNSYIQTFRFSNKILDVEDCPICHDNFHCNDINFTSCGHCYHPWRMDVHYSSSIKCKAHGCEKEFDKAVVTWVHQQYSR